MIMSHKSNTNAASLEGSASFSIRSEDAKKLIQKFRSNQLQSCGGPKEFLNDPQNSYWKKKYDAESFANGWQCCRIKASTEKDAVMIKQEDRLLEPPPLSAQGGPKRCRDDISEENELVRPVLPLVVDWL
jgi:hypothetical protein